MKIDLAAFDCLSDETNKAIHAVNLTSSENKAWKNIRPVRGLNPWPLRYRCEDRFIRFFNRSSYIYDFHIFLVIYSPLGGFI